MTNRTPGTWNGFTDPYGVYTCIKGIPGHTGASHMQLVTAIVPGLTILAGIAISGDVALGGDGFPYTQRPTELNGWWQYNAVVPGSDNALITVELTKWNAITQQRDQIGAGMAVTPGNIPAWQVFSAPIIYSSPDFPDTAIISLTSSGSGVPQIGSVFRVDDLGFDIGTDVTDQPTTLGGSGGPLIIEGATIRATEAVAELAVLGMDGREVISGVPLAVGARLDLSRLAEGTYVLRARTVDGQWHCQRSVMHAR